MLTAGSASSGLLPQVRLRHWGRWIFAACLLVGLGLIAYGLSQGRIQYRLVPDFLFSDIVLQGLQNTIVLAVASQGVAIVIGVGVALMRVSSNPVLNVVAKGYTWIFRGLPILLQILIWYNLALIFPVLHVAVPLTGMTLVHTSMNNVMTPFLAALLGLGLNESAYMAEIVRAGLKSVDKGQVEAAQSLGETPFQCIRRIVLPQAMRVIIPPTGNDFINMLKGTSIVSVIGFVELVRAANNISSRNLLVMETLLAVAIWYLILVTLASIGQSYIERHYDKATSRTGRKRLSSIGLFTRFVTMPFAGRP